jgi:hypothetical protein
MEQMGSPGSYDAWNGLWPAVYAPSTRWSLCGWGGAAPSSSVSVASSGGATAAITSTSAVPTRGDACAAYGVSVWGASAGRAEALLQVWSGWAFGQALPELGWRIGAGPDPRKGEPWRGFWV